MQHSPKILGLLQALGLILYITLFSQGAHMVLPLLKTRFDAPGPESAVPMILFLLTFVTSALICATIAFGYPAYLFLEGKRKTAVLTVCWNILWLIAFFVLFIAGSIFI